MKRSILISIFFLILPGLFAQKGNTHSYHKSGAPLIQYFDPETYQAAPGNHAVLQAPSGFMYMGNDDGVIEFDGSAWRLIPMPNSSPVFSLAIDQSETIFIGAQSELGYLETDPAGQMRYRSLMEFVPEKYQDFSLVTQTFTTDQGVFFHTSLYLFRWKDGEMYVWPAEIQFYSGYCIDGEVYLLSVEDGIRKVEGDSLVLFMNKEAYGNMPVLSMIPYREEKVLFLPISGELKIYSEAEGVADFQADTFVREYLKNNESLGMMILPDQRIAISTIKGGVLIINQDGTPAQMIHTATGLQEVLHMYIDRQQGLWMAMDEGMARVDLFSPYSFWGESQGLNGGVTEVIFAHNRLYIGNRRGIFRQEFDNLYFRRSTFINIPKSPGSFTDMELHLETLFTGSTNSLNKVLFGGTISGGLELPVIQLHAYEKNPGFLIIGFQNGIGVLQKNAEQKIWEFTAHFPEFTTDAFSFVEDSSGALWIGSAYHGVRRFMISDFRQMVDTSERELVPYLIDLRPQIRFYEEDKGIPKGKNKLFKFKESIWTTSEKGLRRFDSANDKFVWEPSMNLDSSTHIIDAAVSAFGDLWVLLDEDGRLDLWRMKQSSESGFLWKKNQLSRIIRSDPPTYLYPDPNDPEILWIGTKNGLYQYDEEIPKPDSAAFTAYIREVKMPDGDSILTEKASLPYTSNSLQFRFAAPAFIEPEKTTYQYYLDGFDSEWSGWTTKAEKDYTNIPEGRYAFRVRAQDVEGNMSQEGVWQFRILPPWYRSWWAYLLYGTFIFILVGALIYGYNRWRIQKLTKRNQELEGLVEKRTTEIQEKNVQLAKSLDHLQQTQQQLVMQEKMASLGQLTMGIAHEIKNPLNFVNNFAEGVGEMIEELEEDLDQLKVDPDPEKVAFIIETLSMLREANHDILINGKRADQIINSMMDHANDNQSEKQKVDINQLIEEQVNLAHMGYQAEIENFQVGITRNLSPKIPEFLLFPQEFGRVMINLVANALYAMEMKQKDLTTSYQPKLEVRSGFEENMVKVSIRDNGTGIPQETLSRVFEPFYTTKPTGKGNTGLGLAICYDIITKGLQGTIEVKSKEGEFTEFMISLPIL